MRSEMLYRKTASAAPLAEAEQRHAVHALFAPWRPRPQRVLIIPPDITRAKSGAGPLTRFIVEHLRTHFPKATVDILPALGTHLPMSNLERVEMFGDLPPALFKVHNWRSGLVKLGDVPGSFVHQVSLGRLDYSIAVELNELLVRGRYNLIISVGQVVPHEVIGMANGNKNILVGTGGKDTINKTHFLGAVCNMETILGRADNPVRAVFDYAEEHFLHDLPLVYVQTVMASFPNGVFGMAGLFIGTGREPFREAAALSQRLNITMLDEPLRKAVVYLDPREFRSTWLGNKAIYRTRMAMANYGQLIILAPGVEMFGEDPVIDRLIRTYGYRGTSATLDAVQCNRELCENLSAAAHLIHGSSEGRFSIIYAPGKLSQQAIESVGFQYASLSELLKRYDPAALSPGFNTVAGEQIYFIPNPGLGLWALRSAFTS